MREPLLQYETNTQIKPQDSRPELSQQADLADCLRCAALNSPDLKAAFNNWKAALEKIPQAGSLPDLQFSYTYFITEIETRVGPQRQRLILSQMFPWLGKLNLRQDAAAAAAQAAQRQYELKKQQLFYEVKHGYYEYYYLGRAIAVAEENLNLLRGLEKTVRIKYQAGIVPQAAIIHFQVDIGKLDDRLQTLRDLQEPRTAKLNAALNRPIDAPLNFPESIEQELETPGLIKGDISKEQLGAALKKNSPNLASLDARIEKSKYEIALSKKDYYPDIGLGLMFIDTRPAVMPVRDSGADPLAVTFSMNLPLNYNKYRAGAREAQARYHQILNQRVELENRLLADLQLALYGYRDARRKIDLYQNALIPEMENLLKVLQQGFAVNQAQYLDIIDAARMLLEYNLAYERARADLGIKSAEIEMLVGYDGIEDLAHK